MQRCCKHSPLASCLSLSTKHMTLRPLTVLYSKCLDVFGVDGIERVERIGGDKIGSFDDIVYNKIKGSYRCLKRYSN